MSMFYLEILTSNQIDQELPAALFVSVRLNGFLCDTVLELSNSQEILTALENSNLFIIPLDTSHQWYRYHDLFGSSCPPHPSGKTRRGSTYTEEGHTLASRP